MISESEQPGRTVKLFLRADPELGCEAQKQAVLERLEALEADGQIDSYDVSIWTKEIRISGALEGTSYYRRVFDHFCAFQKWADEESVRLRSAFKIQSVDCEITDETYRVLSLPSICLAVYDEDDLCAVYPHSDDGTAKTVSNCLDSLETGNVVTYAD